MREVISETVWLILNRTVLVIIFLESIIILLEMIPEVNLSINRFRTGRNFIWAELMLMLIVIFTLAIVPVKLFISLFVSAKKKREIGAKNE